MKKNILLLLVMFIFLVVLNNFLFLNEGFQSLVFAINPRPAPNCSASNNCFAGNYFRSQAYQNMDEPSDINNGGLSRDKISLAGCNVRRL